MLNLNLPSVPLSELRGIRRGWISGAGIIKSADHQRSLEPAPQTLRRARGGPFDGGADHGVVRLELGSAVPSMANPSPSEDESDAALVAAGFGSLTPLLGVRDDPSEAAAGVVAAAIDGARLLLTP
jgi:hypothetical protein